jgi:hypothetical protein
MKNTSLIGQAETAKPFTRLTEKEIAKLASARLWADNMTLLRQIHREIEPVKLELQRRETAPGYVPFENFAR